MWTIAIFLIVGLAVGWKLTSKSEKRVGVIILTIAAGASVGLITTILLTFSSMPLPKIVGGTIENISLTKITGNCFIIEDEGGWISAGMRDSIPRYFYKKINSEKPEALSYSLNITIEEKEGAEPTMEVRSAYYRSIWARLFLLSDDEKIYKITIPPGGKLKIS